jgi:DNA topoisomerase-6 subunit A
MAAKKTVKAAKKTDRDGVTLSKIEKLAKQVLGQATQGNNPALEIRTRTLSNVSFNERKKIIELGDRIQSREFFNIGMARKFMQTMIVAKGCKMLIDEGKTVSIRQMFYMSKHTLDGSSENTFEDQNESDPIIEDLEVGIDALREELHLFANRRGLVVGKLTVNDAGDTIDLAHMGRGGGGSRVSASPTT